VVVKKKKRRRSNQTHASTLIRCNKNRNMSNFVCVHCTFRGGISSIAQPTSSQASTPDYFRLYPYNLRIHVRH
jgi:hypothetical protein